LSDDDSGSITNAECGEKKYMSTVEFVAFAKDADAWVYPGHGDYYFELAYVDFKSDLDQMKSVQNKNVFDTVKTGLSTWYEHRLVEYGKWCILEPDRWLL
jgi:ABC-type Fe3+-hydroxamate transport system substrate-binding protein